jgi:hypothetical protein
MGGTLASFKVGARGAAHVDGGRAPGLLGALGEVAHATLNAASARVCFLPCALPRNMV